jgi:hypothetical protein
MITCKDGRNTPVVMKLSNFLRYYRNLHAVSLSPEQAEEEAVKCGIVIDHSGENKTKTELLQTSLTKRSA